jgi:hypothetical protein
MVRGRAARATDQGPPGTQVYTSEFVHKVSNKGGYVKGNPVALGYEELHDKAKLNKALILARIQSEGARIRDFRIEANGRIVVFPTMPGMSTYWHAIRLNPTALTGVLQS